MIIPPIPTSLSIPQPALLEEPPVPVGLQVDNKAQEQSQQQKQQYPSISLVLPKNSSSSSLDTLNSKSTVADLKTVEDPLASLSQQEELSVKGILNYFNDKNITHRFYLFNI